MPQSTQDRESQLRDRLAAIQIPLSDAATQALREAVCDYVDACKALGWPPEQVLIGLKRIIRESCVPPVRPARFLTGWRRGLDDLSVVLVGWCIERYYARDAQSDTRPPA